jgi:hypothetical protein
VHRPEYVGLAPVDDFSVGRAASFLGKPPPAAKSLF